MKEFNPMVALTDEQIDALRPHPRPAMKTAVATPTAWEITCAACHDVIGSPGSGSQFWTAEDFIGRKAVKCGDCGCESKLPDRLAKLGA